MDNGQQQERPDPVRVDPRAMVASLQQRNAQLAAECEHLRSVVHALTGGRDVDLDLPDVELTMPDDVDAADMPQEVTA